MPFRASPRPASSQPRAESQWKASGKQLFHQVKIADTLSNSAGSARLDGATPLRNRAEDDQFVLFDLMRDRPTDLPENAGTSAAAPSGLGEGCSRAVPDSRGRVLLVSLTRTCPTAHEGKHVISYSLRRSKGTLGHAEQQTTKRWRKTIATQVSVEKGSVGFQSASS